MRKFIKHSKALVMFMVDEVYAHGVKGVMDRINAGEYGNINMNAILVMALMAAVIFIVLANLWPSMQAANTTIQGNTATDVGTATSKTIFGLLLWIIPLGIGIALVIRVLRHDG